MYSLDIGFKFSLLKTNLQLAIVAQDIFKTNIDKAKTSSNSILYNYSDYNDNRYIRISISYKIGSHKISVKQRNFGNEEERNRAE